MSGKLHTTVGELVAGIGTAATTVVRMLAFSHKPKNRRELVSLIVFIFATLALLGDFSIGTTVTNPSKK